MSDKFGKSIGIWHITVGGGNLELKPKLGDNRKFMKLMMSSGSNKDKSVLMDQFSKFMEDLIQRDYPPVDEEDTLNLKMYVEYNVMQLFSEIMVAFRWTTREEMEKQKKDDLSTLQKKLIGDG